MGVGHNVGDRWITVDLVESLFARLNPISSLDGRKDFYYLLFSAAVISFVIRFVVFLGSSARRDFGSEGLGNL